jgi:acyl-CoA reductase-like NAD-dependent aldehyde dehydrogenase
MSIESGAGDLAVLSPYDGSLLDTLARADATALEAALCVADQLHRDRAGWLALPERIGVLNKTADLLLASSSSFAQLIASEGGKPVKDAEVEVARAVEGIHIAVDELRSQTGTLVPFGASAMTNKRLGFTVKEPIGPVVAVSAFNHPLNLIVHQIIPAVAAGCPVIVKPSEDTPLSCVRLVALLVEAGLPQEWCVPFITDDVALAEALVTDPRVAFFSFIGSARVGWMLRSKLSPGTRCSLEHGGAAPVIVTTGAPREQTLNALLKGGFYHAGQVCVSVQRVFVPADEAREFAEQFAARAEKLVVGDPRDAKTDVGPLIRSGEVVRITEWIDEAVRGGADLLTGGSALGGNLFAPTVLFDPPKEVRISRNEVFGPVVCVYPYNSVNEAVEEANSLPFAFQAAVFTRELEDALDLAAQLHASAVMVNDHTAFRSDAMPFAGLKQSGLGVGGIPHTLEDMQIEKLIVLPTKLL